ncbi:NADP-dependent oxidoreductase [Henriciella barbarensis]|uniref:NADP-dependent oxidoreductase n=1 Tax=Henriciella barbarensis TaxID=86342 RepID=A0A399QTC5_9PROT|nr:NADP-dependent oxidoreductase [Henriciella barbarensis]RIJ22098.1 NADP-dependent oxidoreductase [Henriciella barbarensis]
MSDMNGTGWALAKRPVGMPEMDDFKTVNVSAPAPKEGEIQVRNSWMSVDPYMRGRMYDRESYVPPFQIGELLTGGAVGHVQASAHPDYSEGDLIVSMAGWRDVWTGKPQENMVNKVPQTGLPESALLGIAGMPGLTAYAGILRVADLKEGDTVFVSGAAGAVGSTVVQIAKIKNCTVIGSAGGSEKCNLVKELGADHVIDYKAHDSYEALLGALKKAAPKGIDVYFDNVGGDHLQAAIECARPMGRFAICGMISQYNATDVQPGPNNIIQVVGKQLTLKGFIVSTYADMQPQFLKDMATWIQNGDMKFEETVMEGIEMAPEAFLGLFQGRNKGKMLVKLA